MINMINTPKAGLKAGLVPMGYLEVGGERQVCGY